MEHVPAEDPDATEAREGVHLAVLASGDEMSLQHFEVEPGAEVPAHAHPHEQAGYLVEGTLTFLLDDEELTVGPGDSYSIPGEERHGVENREDEVVRGVDVFSPPRADPDWAE